jgi:hypothetical protein
MTADRVATRARAHRPAVAVQVKVVRLIGVRGQH